MGYHVRLTVAVFVCLCVANDVALGMPLAWDHAQGLVRRSRSSSCMGLTFVSRAEWGGRAPRRSTSMPGTPDWTIVHHTVTSRCSSHQNCEASMRSMQNYHMDDKGWKDIGYNFVIGGDARVYVGRGWGIVGAHAGSTTNNQRSIGIAVIGDYSDVKPSSDVLHVLRKLMECGRQLGHLDDQYVIKGHRDVQQTLCPGDRLYTAIQGWHHYHN